MLCTRGDALADEVQRADVGATLAPGDVDGWAAEMENLKDAGAPRGVRRPRRRPREGADLGAGVRPLAAYCAAPHRAPDLAAGGPASPGTRQRALAPGASRRWRAVSYGSMTVCEDIGAWAAGLSVGDVPSARWTALGSRRRRSSPALARESGPRRRSRPWRRTGRSGEVYAGAAASIAHDWDDYLFMGHTGHSAVWVAAPSPTTPTGRSRPRWRATRWAGRLGAALFLGPHNGQFWSSIHCGSAAVAAGVALGLDAERLAHALAIALYQPPYGLWPGFMGPDSKLLTAAEPAVQGARAALLAAQGVTGALDVIEDRRGLLANFSFAPRPAMLGGLGEVWLTDTLAFKPRPGCAYLQAPVDLALGLEIDAADVAEIEVDAGYLTVGMESLGARAGLTPIGVTFSAARSLAVALVAGRLTHEELEPEWLAAHGEDVEALAARVRLRHDWA